MKPGSKADAAGEEWRRNWKMVVAATSGMSLASLSTSSFGVMIGPIQQDLHWTRTEIASGPMLITLVCFSLSAMLGNVVDRLGARLIGVLAVLVLCSALILMSQIGTSLVTWWAIWALVGLGSSVMPAVWLKPVSSSFQTGRGLALAVVLCGSGLSSFVVPSLTNWLVAAHGWRLAYLWLAAIWLVIVLPLVALFHRASAEGVAEAATMPTSADLSGLTLHQGLRSVALYILLLGALASTFLGTALSLNLVPILNSTGLSMATSAAIAGLMGFSILGRLINGWLLDRFKPGLIAGCAVLSMAALPSLLLLLPGVVLTTMIAVLLYGVMGGALLPSLAYLVTRHLGPRNFATFFGAINAIFSIGVGLGPLLANYLYDETGSYRAVLMAAIPLFLIGGLLFASLDRRQINRALQNRSVRG